MKYEEYFDAQDTEVEFHMFLSIRPTNANIESEAFSTSYLEKYYIPYLNKDAHAVGKEALRARINIIEDDWK